MFSWLKEKEIEWSANHFLTTPNPHRGKEPDLARLKLLKLLNLVKQDGDTRDIEAIFREEAKLSYNLPAFGQLCCCRRTDQNQQLFSSHSHPGTTSTPALVAVADLCQQPD